MVVLVLESKGVFYLHEGGFDRYPRTFIYSQIGK